MSFEYQRYTRARHAGVQAKQTTDYRERLCLKPHMQPLKIVDAFVFSNLYLREFF